ncbi:dihydropteroate synthase [Akkermansiaceae bacterium]|jgi:dihydropteroate synthase|nr:dihydropteroate synthase [Akkermansiaceae bacterium]
MKLRFPSETIIFPRPPLLMGIVNINDDSFSGDGTLNPEQAIAQAHQQIIDGADIIDIGAESARTNREAISIDEEVKRLRSFINRWPFLTAKTGPCFLSVNSWRPEVIAQVIDKDIDLLNDMSGLPDAQNAKLCAVHDVPLLIMHSVGQPKISHTHQKWNDLMNSIILFFSEKIELAMNAGLTKEQLILDPGLDFAKQREDNLLVLRELKQLHQFEVPILLPISRKTVIHDVLDIPNPVDRDAATVALLTHGMKMGAQIFRVHNVKASRQAAQVIQPLLS